jgi:small nuclear ribonucleoprotein
MEKRPIDVLDKSKGKRVFVQLKNGSKVNGLLEALDMHLNLWLSDAEIMDEESVKKLGDVLIRGDTIVFVSPETEVAK